ncbi:MAG: hypothetical protein NTU59_01755, partial [Coprothermobacterota bacterium]|nr:hypothetical protein [Coprothermobacterota bacterium]
SGSIAGFARNRFCPLPASVNQGSPGRPEVLINPQFSDARSLSESLAPVKAVKRGQAEKGADYFICRASPP